MNEPRRGLVALPSGAHLEIVRPRVLFLPDYHVVSLAEPTAGPRDVEQMLRFSWSLGRLLSRRRHGVDGCFTVLCHGRETRRRAWPHCHVIVAASVSARRRALLSLRFKGALRWAAGWVDRFMAPEWAPHRRRDRNTIVSTPRPRHEQ